MSRNVLVGGLLAGIAIFCWSAFSHMALPIEPVKAIPNQDSVMAAIKANVPQAGFYLFPYDPPPPGASKEEQKAAMQRANERYRAGPTGILVVHPNGLDPFGVKLLAFELGTDILEGVIAALLLSVALGSPAMAGFFGRVGFVTALGTLAWVAVILSYRIWYGFPTTYVIGEAFDQIGSGFVAGLVLAWRLKPARV